LNEGSERLGVYGGEHHNTHGGRLVGVDVTSSMLPSRVLGILSKRLPLLC
jgi:hypothetical protein